MKKTIIATLLLCTGMIAAGCEKTYSVAEFKKDKKLMEEWGAKCGFAGTSKNCENLRLAAAELDREYFHNLAKKFRGDDQEQKDTEKKQDDN